MIDAMLEVLDRVLWSHKFEYFQTRVAGSMAVMHAVVMAIDSHGIEEHMEELHLTSVRCKAVRSTSYSRWLFV